MPKLDFAGGSSIEAVWRQARRRRARNRSWWRGGEDPELVHDPIEVRLPVAIVDGRDPGLLSAAQAIDVALVDPDFRRLLEANPSIQDWDMPVAVRFDMASSLWEVGLRTKDGNGVVVHIDSATAGVVRVEETP
jgi:hypothetical protein